MSAEQKVFLTFADSRYRAALDRIRKQATDLAFFNQILTLTEVDLGMRFVERHSSLLQPNVRGFGYWLWKPYILNQTLEASLPGDLILYVDAGCHLNAQGIDRLKYYFDHAGSSSFGITVFQARKPDLPLKHDGRELPSFLDESWTKGDLIDRLAVRGNADVLGTPTVGAGIMVVRAHSPGSELVKEWLEICEEDTKYIDDTPSSSPNEASFVEHRHDQSVFSLLVKKRGVPTLSAFEYWYPQVDSMKPDWAALSSFPIHARRDLGRTKVTPKRAHVRALRVVQSVVSRIRQSLVTLLRG